MQGMQRIRDAIVSDNAASVYYVSRKYWSRQLV
jgi:hypothetical protein